MSLCVDCSFLDTLEGFTNCVNGHTTINGDCEWFMEKLQDHSALNKQVAGDHYKKLAIQPIEYCQKNELNYCESNVIKYVTRHRYKNGKEDIKKAIHNLELLMELEYD